MIGSLNGCVKKVVNIFVQNFHLIEDAAVFTNCTNYIGISIDLCYSNVIRF